MTVRARDDTDTDYEELTLALDAGETRHFNSDDLELGNERKRLTGSTGAGTGTWRLALSSDDIDIEAHAYIRTTEGFLTAMHAEAPVAESVHRVATLQPGQQPEPGQRAAAGEPGTRGVPVDIAGTDDDGERPGTPVRIVVPAGDAVEVTAAELESGESETISSGALGGRQGQVAAARGVDRDGDPIAVLSLLSSPTGDLTNLSRADRHARLRDRGREGSSGALLERGFPKRREPRHGCVTRMAPMCIGATRCLHGVAR